MYAATLVLLAQEGGETHAKNPILPATEELIWGGLAFLIVFFVIWRVALPAAGKALQERTEGIEGKLERAERERQEAEQLLQQYKEKLAQADAEAERLLVKARERAEQVRDALTAKAEQEAERELERARQAIRNERDQALRELQQTVGELAVNLAARVVGESLDDRERQLRLIDSYIEELGQHAASGALTGRREDGAGGKG